MQCLEESHFTHKDTDWGMERGAPCAQKEKRAGEVVALSENIGVKINGVKRD